MASCTWSIASSFIASPSATTLPRRLTAGKIEAAQPAVPARARAVLEEALEITPFRKLLYSSDAYGVAEFYCLGALSFRRALAGLLQDRVDADELGLPDALRIVEWAGAHNARRVYRLPGAS